MNLIEVALSQQNVKEHGLNNIIYNTWYYNRVVEGGSYPYCAVFVSWCANKAQLSEEIIPRTASVKTMYNFFVQRNLFHENKDYVPEVGDLMIQRSNGASHVGIVLKADSHMFYTIEGNSSIGVTLNSHSYIDNTITGFASPAYPEKLVFNLDQFSADSFGESMSEEAIWNWFKSKGYDTYATAGIMGWLDSLNAFDEKYNTTLNSLGIFDFRWTTPADAKDIKTVEDLERIAAQQPNSDIGQYVSWCKSRNYQYESAINQLNFFWDKTETTAEVKTLKPEELNCKNSNPSTDEMKQTAQNAIKKFNSVIKGGNGVSEDQAYSKALEYYSSYKGSSGTSTESPTIIDPTKPMREIGEPAVITNWGTYEWTTYTVVSGDTLESIAEKFKITPQMILFANNLTKWEVNPGDVLNIPTTPNTLSTEEAATGVDALTELKHTVNVEVSHPTAEVEFYGEYGKLAAKTTIGKVELNKELENDIISITTSRSLGNDCPTYSIALVWRNKWFDNIASNDLVIIKMYRPGEDHNEVMFGLVDDIRRSIEWTGNQPKRSVRISGRGVNKAFCLFTIGLLENVSLSTELRGGWFTTFYNMANTSSARSIKIAIDAYLGKGLNYRFGDSKIEPELRSLADLIGFQMIEYPNERIIDLSNFTSFSGSLWNFIKELENAPFNETYWEVIGNKPTLVHRPTPFLKENWIKLNRITIKDSDLAVNETGRGDIETYTLFKCEIKIMQESARDVFLPLWYPPFYAKYGLRQMSVTSAYWVHGGDLSQKYEPRKFTGDLFNFYIKNNVFENGSLTVKGSNQYKIGERVILESENMEYYVEGVNHNFNMYGTWTTTLSVTRGIQPELRFTPPYGAGEDLQKGVLLALINLTEGGTIDWHNIPADIKAALPSGSSSQWYKYNDIYFVHPSPQATRVSSPFGPRSQPTEGASSDHKGVDLVADTGDSTGLSIVAAADGKVTYAGPGTGYGNYIEIMHRNEANNKVHTRYAHMSSDTIRVSMGDQVSAGQQIASIGSEGISTGAHLHFELRQNGVPIDPETNLFNNPVANPNAVSNLDGGDGSREATAAAVASFLRTNLGLNKAAICAVLGNIEQESSFIVTNTNSNGAYGLCQWFDRYDKLKNFCQANGYAMDSISGQMAYFKYELETTESEGYSILKSIPDTYEGAGQGAVDFGESFERYGANEEGKRRYYAQQWYQQSI